MCCLSYLLSYFILATTEDGNELHFQVNYLGHFLLTLELLPIILDTATSTGDCRIVIVSSSGFFSGQFVPDNMNAEQSYGRIASYNNSKLYNVSDDISSHTYIHTYIHAYIHTYIVTCIHTYIHSYIHT